MTKDRKNVKTSNCESLDQVNEECTTRTAENHSNLGVELCVHNGPNEASILPTNVRPEENQLDTLVFPKMNGKDKITTCIEDGIFNAINFLRYNCKKRPDATSIPNYLGRTSSADKDTVLSVLQSRTSPEFM